VTFSNDKYPPSSQKEWGLILIKKGAVLGMGSIILPGVTVGEGALIGAGSVVTKNVPAGETVYGNPAVVHTKRNNRE
jgi:acetyltransferase-like isoleucine patch superfamily enzyme